MAFTRREPAKLHDGHVPPGRVRFRHLDMPGVAASDPDSRAGGSAADRDDLRAPRAAGRGDVDLVALLRAEQRSAERRLGRDAPHAGDLDLHALALLVLDLDGRADRDGVAL